MAFKKGDRIIFTGIQNFRGSPAGGDNGDSFVGMIGTVFDGPRTATYLGVSYTWWDIHADNGLFGWVADVGKFKLYTAPTPPEPPKPPSELETIQKELSDLKVVNEGLRNDLGASLVRENTIKAELELVKSERDEIQRKYDILHVEKNRLENELGDWKVKCSELQLELESVNKNFIKKIVDAISEWLAKITSSDK